MKKALMVEDHSIVIRGFQLIFEREFTDYSLDTVSSIADMMKALQKNRYVIAIMDMQLEDGISMSMVPDVIRLYPQMAVLMFTGFSEELYAKRLFEYGVKGFLNKNSSEQEIIYALRTITAGKTYFSEQYKNILINKSERNGGGQNPFNQLSTREFETALLLLQGKKGSEICSELNIQPSTVTTYKIKIFTKLGVNNVMDMQKLASAHQVI